MLQQSLRKEVINIQYKGYTIVVSESDCFIYSKNGLVTKTETVDEALALIDLTVHS